MNENQIRAILQCDYMTKDRYGGVYSIDELPIWQRGRVYVINTDEQDKPGEHWVAVYDNEYFDSFGFPPMDKRLIQFLPKYTYNATPLQRVLSNACGFYCVYYILQRARGNSAKDIIDVLKHSDSDFIVKHAIYDCYKPLFH